MFLSEDFSFNGKRASALGIKLVRMESSNFIEEPIVGSTSLLENPSAFDFKPHLYEVIRDPIEFTLQLALANNERPLEWTRQSKQLIYTWLLQPGYKPLTFDDDPDLVYYAVAVGNPTLNTLHGFGYIEISFRTNSPYPWAREQVANLTGNIGNQSIHTVYVNYSLPYKKVYFDAELTRIPNGATESSVGILNNSTPPVTDFIRLQASLIPTHNKIFFNSKSRTVTAANGDYLYKYKTPNLGDQFPYLIEGKNDIVVPQGWSAKITYQPAVLR